MPLNIKPSSGSGSITLAATTGTTTNDTLTLPAKTGNIITSADSGTVTGTMLASATVAQSNLATNVAGNGPAFSVYANASVSLSANTNTKITFGATSFDTASAVSSSKFQPAVAGYYFIVSSVECLTAGNSYFHCKVYKNGSSYAVGVNFGSSATAGPTSQVSTVVYCNGSTDYIEIYAIAAGASTTSSSSSTFSGYLARSA